MTPDEIARIITEDPDVFNENLGKKLFAGGALLSLAALGTLGGLLGKPKASLKLKPQAITRKPEPQQQQRIEPSIEKPKFIKKPKTSGVKQMALDNIWIWMTDVTGVPEDQFTKELFIKVFTLYGQRYGGGKVDKDVIRRIALEAGFSKLIVDQYMDQLMQWVDRDRDGVVNPTEFTSVFK